MIEAGQMETRSIETRASKVPVIRILSAVVSRKAPSIVAPAGLAGQVAVEEIGEGSNCEESGCDHESVVDPVRTW